MRPIRHGLLACLVACTASACGGMQYKDSNAAVDANPLCVSRPDQPNEPVAKECERKSEVSWGSEHKPAGKPIDFGRKSD